MKKVFKILFLVLFVFLVFNPHPASAVDCYDPVTGAPIPCPGSGGGGGIGCDLSSSPKLQDLFTHVTCIIYKSIIPMLFALAVAMFVYGVVQYVINTSDEGKREKGKTYMVWGIIGLTVMVSVWGLVSILGGTFGVDTSVIPQGPE